jgi:hypothetical protein
MRRRCDSVIVTTGNYAGQIGTVESNVHHRSVDYPGEFANAFHEILDAEDLLTLP